MSAITSETEIPLASNAPGAIGIRVWPAVALLVCYWGASLFVFNSDMAMLPRFISRCVIWLVTVLVFLGWWVLNRRVSWVERLGMLGCLVVSAIALGILCHPTAIAALVLEGLPVTFTGWTICLAVCRYWRSDLRRIVLATVIPVTLSPILLVRCEGIDGTQRTVFKWRWSQSAEELFLANRPGVAPAVQEPIREWIVRPGDCPEFRGPNRDGAFSGVSISDDWKTTPPKLVWRQRVGPGWASMIVVDGFLMTQEQRGEQEAIVCYRADTGLEVWSYEAPGRFDEAVSGLGPRGTPTFHQGRVFALGATGHFTCVAADTGKLIWKTDIKQESGAKVPQWGYSTSPLVHDDLAIVLAGGDRGRSLIACRIANGEVAWASGDGTLSYSSPQFVELHGRPQILMHDNKTVAGINPTDGQAIWKRAVTGQMEEPMIQPHVINDSSIVISSGSGLARVDLAITDQNWTTADRWTSISIKPDFNDVLIHEGHIYGLDDGILCCVNLETGRRRWKNGRYGHGQMLLLSDRSQLLIACENGDVALVAAKPEKFEELGRFHAIEGKTWNHPVIADQRLYVRNNEEMACYEIR